MNVTITFKNKVESYYTRADLDQAVRAGLPLGRGLLLLEVPQLLLQRGGASCLLVGRGPLPCNLLVDGCRHK